MIACTGRQPAPAATRALHRWCLFAMAGLGSVPTQADASIAEYVITVDADAPLVLRGSMRLQAGDTTVWPARHGNAGAFNEVRCSDGRPAETLQSGWQIPQGCQQVEWDVRTVDLNASPADATVPQMICPLLSGPKLMVFWMTKETWNAEQEASPGRDYRQAA